MPDRRPGPVLVTGANSGIGLAATLRLASRRWTVYGTVRNEAKADQLRELAREAEVGRRVHPLVLDVSNHDAVVETWPDLPDFYAVVNNAGYSETGPVEEVSAARAKAQLDINLVTPAVVSSCALPGMRRRGDGRIIMMSSVAGRASVLPLNGWYHASKFGLEALSDVLRVEVGGFGVKVVLIEPGIIKTNFGQKMKDRVHQSPAQKHSPYARAYQRIETILSWIERIAPGPDAVARAVVEGIESKNPNRRYVVGLDALATLATQPFTPRELTDAAMRLTSGLMGGGGKDD